MESEGQAPVRAGEVLAGKYAVESVLGAGGMGVVVAATHVQLGQRVALKFLLPGACGNAEAVERFLREARAAVQIQSEHVARVSDVGTLETGSPYMVMEFLQGTDLDQIVRSRGPLPIPEAVDAVLQACEAIAEAHALGIVHRDLKPANLFVTQRADGSSLIKVLDFGISKARSLDSRAGMTATSSVMGSPFYMSPEQMRSSKNVDHRTDVWSLGVILHELLTAHPVFEAETIPDLCVRIATEPPTPLRHHRPDAPAELEAVVLRCLERDLSKRWQNVAELAQALLPFAPKSSRISVERITRVIQGAGMSTSALALPPSSVSPPALAAGTVGGWGATGRIGKPAKTIAAVGAVVGLLTIAGAALLVLRSSGKLASSATAGSAPLVATTTTGALISPGMSAEPAASGTQAAPITASASASASASAVAVVPPAKTPTKGGEHPATKPPATTKPPKSKGGTVDPLADQR